MEISSQIGGNGFSMRDLLAKSGFELPKVGEVMAGEIISVSKNAVLVDLGPLGTGIVYPSEFYDNPEIQKTLKAGQQVSAILLDIENDDGYRELSLKQAQMTTAWEDIRNKKESGQIITTKVININKGGLIVEIDGVQGFLPLSQLAPEHYPKVEGGDTTKIVQALQKMRGQDIQIKIIDFSEDENRLIASEKAINEEQLKDEVAKLKVGEVVDAEVTEVTDFGAFVAITITPEAASQPQVEKQNLRQPELVPSEIPPEPEKKPSARIEGLIHISEIDWKLVENPRDLLKQGEIVKAKIIAIEGSKVSLSLKALKPNPWEGVEQKYSAGQTITGEILKITNYGVIVKLDEELNGMIPISEFGEKKPPDSLKLGENINVAIVSIDVKDHKIFLTLQNPS
jgi:small subunit ribosomal protein S1